MIVQHFSSTIDNEIYIYTLLSVISVLYKYNHLFKENYYNCLLICYIKF